MYKIILITLISIFISSFSRAEIVKKIEIIGNKRISSETVKIYGNIEKNKNYSDKDLNSILNDLYNNQNDNAEVNLAIAGYYSNFDDEKILIELINLSNPNPKEDAIIQR